ncbi:hypothetical protein SDC9_152505 [bioreactor metagenome]|uniref:Uncharacterized protein n=1 Tax=bioreactor metagenome TaxID=1076179 RepID=A0A645ETA4_9ZZZZ
MVFSVEAGFITLISPDSATAPSFNAALLLHAINKEQNRKGNITFLIMGNIDCCFNLINSSHN